MIQFVRRYAALLQTVLDCVYWKASPVLFSREAFLLGRSNQISVPDQTSRRASMVRIDSEYVQAFSPLLSVLARLESLP